MIAKILTPFSKPKPNFNLLLNHTQFFQLSYASQISDPYYILGVDKTADIATIKKAFYKLANQYHPDKTAQSNQNSTKFLLIKQAYESIKLQKGLIKPTGFVYDHDVKSMRPDASRFQTDDEQNRKSQADFRMYQEKAQASGEEYEQFRGTFKTLNDINDIKIRVQKGQMRDASKRFNLNSLQTKITKLRQNGLSSWIFVIAAMTSFYMLFLHAQNMKSTAQLNKALQQQQSKQVNKRRVFDQKEEQKNRNEEIIAELKGNQNLKENRGAKEFLEKAMAKKVIQSRKQIQIQTGDNSV